MQYNLREFLPFLCIYGAFFLVFSCKQTGPGWKAGGGEDWVDTGLKQVPDDSGQDDTADTSDTSETGDTSETSDTDDSSDTSDTGPKYEGTGYDAGDIAYELLAANQAGMDWSLYAHDTGPVVLVFGYATSTNFQHICDYLPELQADWSDDGVSFATVLLLDSVGVIADQSDAASWASTWGLSTVLWDKYEGVAYEWASPTQVKVMLIAADMEITWVKLEATDQVQLDDQIHDLIFE